MKLALVTLLAAPCVTQATLIEYTGAGDLTYYWEDQAHPTGTISFLAGSDSIHSLTISNTKTQLTYEDVEVDWFYSVNLNHWVGGFNPQGHVADFAPVDELFDAYVIWEIDGPQSLNPYDHLTSLRDVFVGSNYREFEFQPTSWTKNVVGAVPVPEPGSMALMAGGLLGLWRARR